MQSTIPPKHRDMMGTVKSDSGQRRLIGSLLSSPEKNKEKGPKRRPTDPSGGEGPENVTKIPDFSSFKELIFGIFWPKFAAPPAENKRIFSTVYVIMFTTRRRKFGRFLLCFSRNVSSFCRSWASKLLKTQDICTCDTHYKDDLITMITYNRK